MDDKIEKNERGGAYSVYGEGRGVYRGDPGVGEITILKWILWKWGMGLLTGSSWLRIGAGVEHL